jgi:hypothetical protein
MKSVIAVLYRSSENRVYDAYSLEAWRDKFAMELERTTVPEALGIKQAFFQFDNGGFIDIVAPTNDQSAVGSAIESPGENMPKDNHKDSHNEQIRR